MTTAPNTVTPIDRSPSVRFTEQMAGWFTLGVSDPRSAGRRARNLGHRLMFELTISCGPLNTFVADPQQAGTATGYVASDVMGGKMSVERGWFNLFVAQPEPVGVDRPARRMRYRLWFRDAGGTPFTLVGFKVVEDDPGFDLWSDTTTLYTQVVAGHVAPGEAYPDDQVRGAGVLHITPRAFARQLTTFASDGPHRGRAILRFGRLFVGELWAVFVAPKWRRLRRRPTPEGSR